MAVRRKSRDGGDLTTQILVQIRDEIRHVRDEVTHLRAATNERFVALEARQSEDAMRLSTEVVAAARAVGQVRDLLSDQRVDRRRLDDHEGRLARIEKKIA